MSKQTIPEWLIKLPSGSYTLTELVELSDGKSKTSIHRTLKRLHVKKTISQKVVYRNLVEIIYEWENPYH